MHSSYLSETDLLNEETRELVMAAVEAIVKDIIYNAEVLEDSSMKEIGHKVIGAAKHDLVQKNAQLEADSSARLSQVDALKAQLVMVQRRLMALQRDHQVLEKEKRELDLKCKRSEYTCEKLQNELAQMPTTLASDESADKLTGGGSDADMEKQMDAV